MSHTSVGWGCHLLSSSQSSQKKISCHDTLFVSLKNQRKTGRGIFCSEMPHGLNEAPCLPSGPVHTLLAGVYFLSHRASSCI